MSKQVLIDTIGRVFVDNDFRNKFNGNPESAIAGISGLSDKEKEFLKEMSAKIGECAAELDLTYEDDKGLKSS